MISSLRDLSKSKYTGQSGGTTSHTVVIEFQSYKNSLLDCPWPSIAAGIVSHLVKNHLALLALWELPGCLSWAQDAKISFATLDCRCTRGIDEYWH